MPLLASCHEHESILAYTSGKRQVGHAGVAGKSKHARWCLQWSRIQAHIQVNRLFGQLSFTAKSGVLAELIDVLAWSGSARIGLHTIYIYTRYIFIVLTIKCSTVQRIRVLDVIVGAAKRTNEDINKERCETQIRSLLSGR